MCLLEQDYKSWKENVTYFSWNYEHVPPSYFSQKKKQKTTQNKQQNSNNSKTTIILIPFPKACFLALCSRLQPAIWEASPSRARLPSEGRSRLHRHPSSACTTPPFSEGGSEGMGSFQKEEVWICILYPADTCEKAHFLLKTVTSTLGLAIVLNLLFVKFFISETRTSLEKWNIHSYIIICLCKSMLVFAPKG